MILDGYAFSQEESASVRQVQFVSSVWIMESVTDKTRRSALSTEFLDCVISNIQLLPGFLTGFYVGV